MSEPEDTVKLYTADYVTSCYFLGLVWGFIGGFVIGLVAS